MRAPIFASVVLAVLTSVRAAGAHLHDAPARPPVVSGMLPADAGSLGGLFATALLCGLLLAMARERDGRPRVKALASGVLMLTFLAESAPHLVHLVHHALAADQGPHGQVLVSADHADATATLATDLPPVPLVASRLAEVSRGPGTVSTPPVASGRAPPVG